MYLLFIEGEDDEGVGAGAVTGSIELESGNGVAAFGSTNVERSSKFVLHKMWREPPYFTIFLHP